MRRLTAAGLVAIVVVATIAGGCNRSTTEAIGAASSGNVAIIDLNRVARQLGRDLQIVDEIRTRESLMDDSLSSLRDEYRQQLAAEKKLIGDEPTPEQTKKLQSISQEAKVRFQQAALEAAGHLAEHRASLIREFHSEVQPVAQYVAEEFGLSVVVAKNENLKFAYGSAVDITDEVVKRLRPITATIPGDQPPAFRSAKPPSNASLLH